MMVPGVEKGGEEGREGEEEEGKEELINSQLLKPLMSELFTCNLTKGWTWSRSPLSEELCRWGGCKLPQAMVFQVAV